MNDHTLATCVNQLESLDRERRHIALAAFQRLAATDRELHDMGIETFDSENTAAGWFSEPVDSLGGEIPLAPLLKGQRENVINCLGQIQHGIYA